MTGAESAPAATGQRTRRLAVLDRGEGLGLVAVAGR
jgi:hypothetical protein